MARFRFAAYLGVRRLLAELRVLRPALIVVGAVALTFALQAAAGFVVVHTSAVGQLGMEADGSGRPARDLARNPKYADHLFESLERGLWVSRLLVKPLIGCLIGLFVGALAIRWVGQLAALGALPLAAMAFDTEGRGLEGLAWAAGYLFVTCATALALRQWREQHRRRLTSA